MSDTTESEPVKAKGRMTEVIVALSLFVICVVLPGCLIGCGGAAVLVGAVVLSGDSEQAVTPDSGSYWSDLAADIQGYPIGYPDTDVLLKTADGALKRGVIKDMSRLDSLKRAEPITDSNRDQILRTVRGN